MDHLSAQKLWCEVLQCAIADALHGSADPSLSSAHKVNATIDARDYVSKPNRDFDMVCALAGVDADAVRNEMRKRLAQPQKAPPSKAQKPKLIEHDGLTLTIKEWSERVGLAVHTIRSRLKAGWPTERVLNPKMQYHSKPGVSSNITDTYGTGGGTAAQDRTKIAFLENT